MQEHIIALVSTGVMTSLENLPGLYKHAIFSPVAVAASTRCLVAVSEAVFYGRLIYHPAACGI